MALLRRDGYDVELLLSYGTSKGGSAGHVALAVSGELADDDVVYYANLYADRDPKHAALYEAADLVLRIPKKEYLYGTSSTLGARAAFGLDFGEVYKRTVFGIRVFGMPTQEKERVAQYLQAINADFHARERDTEYHRGEVKYRYTDLNCAKVIGSAFHYGAGYRDVAIRSAPALAARKLAAALNANTPSELAVQLMRAFDARAYTMDVVVYRKYPGSGYIDPRDDETRPFAELPDRFPSAISLDFRNDDGAYRDYDNLFALALLRDLGRYEVVIDSGTRALQVVRAAAPMTYADAARAADKAARAEAGRRTIPKTVEGRTP
jgi:hypothetical protein